MQNKKNWLVAFLIIWGVWATAGYGQQVTKIQAWPPEVSNAGLDKIKALIDPDPALPQPAIKDSLMREFTKGSTNTVEWSTSEIEKALDDTTEVKFFEIKAEYQNDGQDYLLWGIVNSPDSSATFTNLPEYVKISYYIRYFVRDQGKAGFRMSYWSEPVSSIQDFNPPFLDPDSSSILNLNELHDQNWVIGNIIPLRIVASDLPIGKLELIKIQEEGSSEVSHPVLNPATEIDTVISYTLKTRQKTPVLLEFWVTDVSLQFSYKKSVTLIWMSEEEGLDALICFPNPFNPEYDQCVKIKVGVENVTDGYIFDAFGNLISELTKESGADFFTWDGRNGRGDFVSSGGYLCVLKGKQKYYCKIAVYR